MTKAYSKLNSKNQIAIPRGICREIKIKPGDNLELVLAGPNKARKLVIAKKYIGGK